MAFINRYTVAALLLLLTLISAGSQAIQDTPSPVMIVVVITLFCGFVGFNTIVIDLAKHIKKIS